MSYTGCLTSHPDIARSALSLSCDSINMMNTQSLTSGAGVLARPADGVVVLGMSRSGTSAVAGMLVSAGFHAGQAEQLMEPSDANPRGYFENVAIRSLNDEILGELGGTWFAPPDEAMQRHALASAEPRLRSALERLVDEANGAPVVLKDPRIGVMLELWGPLIAERLHPVLVIRDPVEVALSLSVRDGTPILFALAMWELHIAAVLRHMGNRVVTVAPYRQLLDDPELPERIVEAAAAHLIEDRAQRVVASAAGNALDGGLHRQQHDGGDYEQYMTGHQMHMWRWLSCLPPGDQMFEPPVELLDVSEAAARSVKAERERQRERTDMLTLQHSQNLQLTELGKGWELIRQDRDRILQDRDRLRHELDATRRELQDALAAQRSRADVAHAALQQTSERLDAVSKQLDVICRSRSWKMTGPLRAIAEWVRGRR